jgi:hypothetical protein
MSKTHKKGRTPNIPPAAVLRIRLDGLWQNPAMPRQEQSQLEADLDAVTRGIKSDALVPVMLRAYLNAPDEARAWLDRVVPGWLQARAHLPSLEKLTVNQDLDSSLQPTTLAWLAAAGRDVREQLAQPDPFYGAYDFDNSYQAAVTLIWYSDPKRTRARGMNFLIDYHPPWDGAIKDIIYFPQRPPKDLVKRYVEAWEEDDQPLTPISAIEAKQKILHALECNRKSEIRLPRDLIAVHEELVRHVLSLPNRPDTPPITAEDIEFLCQHGQRPEDIVHLEHTVGRRTRLDDGTEVLVIGEPDEDEW